MLSSSVLAQKTTFRFNLIIVDNHSTDGTSEAIGKYTADGRVVHLVPERSDLGIAVAGTWVCIIRLVASLPSSSIATMYICGPDTLQKIVDAFYDRTARWLSEPIG